MDVNSSLEKFRMEIHMEVVNVISKTMKLDEITNQVSVNGGEKY